MRFYYSTLDLVLKIAQIQLEMILRDPYLSFKCSRLYVCQLLIQKARAFYYSTEITLENLILQNRPRFIDASHLHYLNLYSYYWLKSLISQSKFQLSVILETLLLTKAFIQSHYQSFYLTQVHTFYPHLSNFEKKAYFWFSYLQGHHLKFIHFIFFADVLVHFRVLLYFWRLSSQF